MTDYPPELEIRPFAGPVDTIVAPPGSKSYTNRALVLAALADGESTLTGALFSDDTLYMAEALGALGFEVEGDEAASRFRVGGKGGHIPAKGASLFVGNSGTTARFLAPVCALGHGTFRIDGVEAMRRRPIQPLMEALNDLGSRVSSVEGTGCPPIEIVASGIPGGHCRMRGDLSSQYFSALLLAAPCFERGLDLEVIGDLVSKPYLDVTGQTMTAFGGAMENEGSGYRRFRVAPGRYRATEYRVEPDASAASYFFAAAAITGGRVRVAGLGSSSLQGDLGFVRLLERMGCTVNQSATETEVCGPPAGTRLRRIDVDMADLSDTAQTLAVVAAFAEGPTRITGIGFIRRKETDRIGAMVRELNRLGATATEEADGLSIHPGALRPARIETYDDHRMAMSFALAGLVNPGVTVLDPACVAKTFPRYFEALEALRPRP